MNGSDWPPARWTSHDGAALTIRPIVGTDEAMEAAFVARLSHDTSYQRLLSGRTPQPDEIARWTHIDYRREMAFVGIADDGRDTARICGVARYVCAGDGTAAFAIVLADDWQRRGLGTALMRTLIGAAREAGVAVLSDITLSTNTAMRTLAKKLGFTVSRVPGDATLHRLVLVLVSGEPGPT